MARKMFSCDFETTTDPDDCRVWAYGWMEIGNRKNYKIGNSLDEFMNWCEQVKATLYFHNLKFDGSFIINWLLHKGFKFSKDGEPNTFNAVISSMGQWYIIDICYGYKGKKKLHTIIYDSLKKLPFKVKEIAKDFGLEIRKGEIDYHAYRPPGHEITEEEAAYIINDIEIIAQALEIQFKQGLEKLTNGSDSLHGFKSIIGTKVFEKYFPVMALPVDKNIRRAYRGGFTWLNEKFAEKEIGEGIVMDVNSQYPAQMYDKPLPYGLPIYFEGEYENDEQYPLYIQHIKCEFEIKEKKIPTIQIKGHELFKHNEYLYNSKNEIVDLYVTNVDLKLIEEHYELYNVEYIEGWKFKAKTGLFKQFIDKWTYVKTHETGAKRLLAKLMLNSLYGKFATNPDVTGKVPYLKDDGSLGFRMGEQEFKDPIYTPMGVFITSWARFNTISTAQACYDRIIYCDTDSIHLVGTEIPESIRDIVDDKKLGYWAHEGTFKRAKYIRQKTYYQELYAKEVEKDGEIKLKECSPEEATTLKKKIACAGMPDNVKKNVTFDNFKRGYTDVRLKPRQVRGGVVLEDQEFTIK